MENYLFKAWYQVSINTDTDNKIQRCKEEEHLVHR